MPNDENIISGDKIFIKSISSDPVFPLQNN